MATLRAERETNRQRNLSSSIFSSASLGGHAAASTLTEPRSASGRRRASREPTEALCALLPADVASGGKERASRFGGDRFLVDSSASSMGGEFASRASSPSVKASRRLLERTRSQSRESRASQRPPRGDATPPRAYSRSASPSVRQASSVCASSAESRRGEHASSPHRRRPSSEPRETRASRLRAQAIEASLRLDDALRRPEAPQRAVPRAERKAPLPPLPPTTRAQQHRLAQTRACSASSRRAAVLRRELGEGGGQTDDAEEWALPSCRPAATGERYRREGSAESTSTESRFGRPFSRIEAAADRRGRLLDEPTKKIGGSRVSLPSAIPRATRREFAAERKRDGASFRFPLSLRSSRSLSNCHRQQAASDTFGRTSLEEEETHRAASSRQQPLARGLSLSSSSSASLSSASAAAAGGLRRAPSGGRGAARPLSSASASGLAAWSRREVAAERERAVPFRAANGSSRSRGEMAAGGGSRGAPREAEGAVPKSFFSRPFAAKEDQALLSVASVSRRAEEALLCGGVLPPLPPVGEEGGGEAEILRQAPGVFGAERFEPLANSDELRLSPEEDEDLPRKKPRRTALSDHQGEEAFRRRMEEIRSQLDSRRWSSSPRPRSSAPRAPEASSASSLASFGETRLTLEKTVAKKPLPFASLVSRSSLLLGPKEAAGGEAAGAEGLFSEEAAAPAWTVGVVTREGTRRKVAGRSQRLAGGGPRLLPQSRAARRVGERPMMKTAKAVVAREEAAGWRPSAPRSRPLFNEQEDLPGVADALANIRRRLREEEEKQRERAEQAAKEAAARRPRSALFAGLQDSLSAVVSFLSLGLSSGGGAPQGDDQAPGGEDWRKQRRGARKKRPPEVGGSSGMRNNRTGQKTPAAAPGGREEKEDSHLRPDDDDLSFESPQSPPLQSAFFFLYIASPRSLSFSRSAALWLAVVFLLISSLSDFFSTLARLFPPSPPSLPSASSPFLSVLRLPPSSAVAQPSASSLMSSSPRLEEKKKDTHALLAEARGSGPRPATMSRAAGKASSFASSSPLSAHPPASQPLDAFLRGADPRERESSADQHASRSKAPSAGDRGSAEEKDETKRELSPLWSAPSSSLGFLEQAGSASLLSRRETALRGTEADEFPLLTQLAAAQAEKRGLPAFSRAEPAEAASLHDRESRPPSAAGERRVEGEAALRSSAELFQDCAEEVQRDTHGPSQDCNAAARQSTLQRDRSPSSQSSGPPLSSTRSQVSPPESSSADLLGGARARETESRPKSFSRWLAHSPFSPSRSTLADSLSYSRFPELAPAERDDVDSLSGGRPGGVFSPFPAASAGLAARAHAKRPVRRSGSPEEAPERRGENARFPLQAADEGEAEENGKLEAQTSAVGEPLHGGTQESDSQQNVRRFEQERREPFRSVFSLRSRDLADSGGSDDDSLSTQRHAFRLRNFPPALPRRDDKLFSAFREKENWAQREDLRVGDWRERGLQVAGDGRGDKADVEWRRLGSLRSSEVERKQTKPWEGGSEAGDRLREETPRAYAEGRREFLEGGREPRTAQSTSLSADFVPGVAK
ncbi:hypothetical protein BESB_082120 [Besnoitia besnoiti]|uniref:Uncharacterized protein n=1 Tax=Besnoitia besnoiti TaxID=94643 RepID=A0A2A9MBF9_BESBE|nr:hypothetical protein BESB_082120 [Besnoitia besnoiti]PFH33013.1 hypothetical protein BESB_082120 [Besnoitia besnoiti]